MRGIALALSTVALAACAPEFDKTRVGVDPGTFGHRVVTLMCKRLAFQAKPTDVSGDTYRETCRGGPAPEGAPPAIIALVTNRARLEKAIDAVVPEDVYDPLQAYLTSDAILGLYDDDTMSKSIASLGDMLSEMSDDELSMAVFERQGSRAGYRPVPQAIGPTGSLMNSSQIRPVLDQVLPTIVDGGSAKTQWDALVAAISMSLLDASEPLDAASPTRVAAIANEFLMTEHADLGEPTPLLMLRRDHRGLAKVALANGNIPAPFSDADDDKLADVDAQGHFVDATGAPIIPPSPFLTTGDASMRDEAGRAVDGNGRAIYEYISLDKTLMGQMAYDQPALLENGTAIDMLRGTSYLMGDRKQDTRTFENGSTLAYNGYDVDAGSPILDLAHAFTQLLHDVNTHDMLALTDELFTNHEAATARLLEAAITAARTADAHPEAQVLVDAPVWDDLIPIVQKITANTALTKDLMLALKRPEVKQLATRFREFMTYTNRFDIAANQTVTGSLTTMPDRTQPDTGFNRSLFERLLHVINDTNGSVECSKAGAHLDDPLTGLPLATFANACEFYRIPNMAVFYLQTMVYAKDANGQFLCETTAGAFGNTTAAATPEACEAQGRRARRKATFQYNWPAVVRAAVVAQGGDAFLETQSTIQGFRTHPTTPGLNRALFLEPRPESINDVSDPPRDKFGELVGVKHAGTLPVWEKNNFYTQVQPVLQAFADHDAEQLFVDLMSALHKHWASKDSTSTQHTSPVGENYTYGSNLVSFEPLVIEILQGDLWPTLTETATELNGITVRGKSFATVVANSGKFLTTPMAGLADRAGNTSTVTSDGRAVPMLTPFHLLADAEVRKRARLETNPQAAQLWTQSAPELVDLWFRAEQVEGTWRFKNRHVVAVTRGVTQLLRGRLDEHDAAGDRKQWLAVDLPKKLRDFFTHPIIAAAADFLEAQAAGLGRATIEALLRDVFTPGTPAFDTMRIGGADLLQLAYDDADLVPLARLGGRLTASDRSYLATQLYLLSKLHAADTESTLTGIVARLFRPFDDAADPGIPALSAIIDGVGEVDRTAPGAVQPPWSMYDYKAVFFGVGAFMKEEQRGLPRFVTIVKGRGQ